MSFRKREKEGVMSLDDYRGFLVKFIRCFTGFFIERGQRELSGYPQRIRVLDHFYHS